MSLAVLDAAGRVVAHVLRDTRVVGRVVVPWDRRTSHGMRAAPGVYFLRAAFAGGTVLHRHVVLL